ncbi:MAG: transporter substrate-binding domain-containing protein [Herpetosiphonaceae bacterium]|nr:transporter substrate-binding domain-containing protein [Herpetosiphonaceae bacterium]
MITSSHRRRVLISLVLLFSTTWSLAACGSPAQKNFDSVRLTQIQQSKKLVVGTALTAPFESRDQQSGNLVGFDVDLAQRIAAELGVTIEWKELAFSELLPALEQGTLDMVIAALYITPQRQELVGMSQAYVDTGLVIVTRTATTDIRTVADLNGKKVGVKKGATGARFATKLKDKGNSLIIQEYTETIDSVVELEKGLLDAILNDKINSIQYAKTHPTIMVASEVLDPAGLGIAVKKGDLDLLNLINSVIDTARSSGVLDQLYQQWISQ